MMSKEQIQYMIEQPTKSRCIGIVGLGLIGGSLGLELQSRGWEVHGVVHRSATLKRAKERKLANVISTNLEILNDCQIIFIALPLDKIINPSNHLINSLPKSAVITDVGSVKSPVVKTWQNLHPRFVGSHPMAGSAEEGVNAGELGLFNQRPWVATPNSKTDIEALEIIHQIAISIGSEWITTDANKHDEAVALISHLPVFISAALLKTLGNLESKSINQLAKSLASSGFSDTSRVGGGNPNLGKAMAQNNTKEILKALNSYRKNIEDLERKIQLSSWEQLQIDLEFTKQLRSDFIKGNQSN